MASAMVRGQLLQLESFVDSLELRRLLVLAVVVAALVVGVGVGVGVGVVVVVVAVGSR